MNTADRIIAALSPGNPFNANGLIWRSVGSLSQYAGVGVDEVLELLVGDLAGDVAVKPSKKEGVGLLAALKANLPADPEAGGPVKIAGGPAFNPGQNPCAEVPLGGEIHPVQALDDLLAEGVANVNLVDHGQSIVAEAHDLEEAQAGMDPNEPAMD